LCIIVRRQVLQFIFECPRLGARLEMTELAGRDLFFVPDAIGQRLNALPQEIIPTRAPPNITANKSSEINRSFMTGISPLVADKGYPHS
jgi:hypothetical protein